MVLDTDSSGERGRVAFEDLDHDGINELVIENEHLRYGSGIPQVFKWDAVEGVFKEAAAQFLEFWEARIKADMGSLRAGGDADKQVCDRLLKYFGVLPP